MANFFSQLRIKEIFVSANTALFLWIGTALCIIITFILAYYKVRTGPSSVALHYNVLIGVDLLGNKSRLYLVPLTGAIIAIINLIISRLLSVHDPFLKIVLAAGSFLSSIIILWAFLLLFRVN